MKTIIWSVLVLCCAGIVPAQERAIDKAEFDNVITQGNNHQLRWKGEKYRMTVTTSSKAAGRPQTDYSSKIVIEYGPSMENRSISTSVFGDKPASTRESMRIGNSVYTRSGNGAWTRKEYVASEPAKEREESPFKVLSSQAEYRYLGQINLKDQPAHLYVKTERQTKVSQKSGETAESETKTTYWVDAKGTILKSEFRADHRGTFSHQTSVITEWELDPSIAFTAPEITP